MKIAPAQRLLRSGDKHRSLVRQLNNRAGLNIFPAAGRHNGGSAIVDRYDDQLIHHGQQKLIKAVSRQAGIADKLSEQHHLGRMGALKGARLRLVDRQ